MGQKCNPILMRAGKIDKSSASVSKLDKVPFGYKRYTFYARNNTEYSRRLNNAIAIEHFIKTKFTKDFIGDIYVSFVQNTAIVDIFSTKVGALLGKNASGIEMIRKGVLDITKNDNISTVTINPHEIKKSNLDANIVCEAICREIEKKRGNANIKRHAETIMRSGAEGVKISISGRISGAEIARTDKVRKGKINATTLKANINFAQSTAKTQYGIIGVTVFINVGNQLDQESFKPRTRRSTREHSMEREPRTEQRATTDKEPSQEQSQQTA